VIDKGEPDSRLSLAGIYFNGEEVGFASSSGAPRAATTICSG
jgi:hypothetical protein